MPYPQIFSSKTPFRDCISVDDQHIQAQILHISFLYSFESRPQSINNYYHVLFGVQYNWGGADNQNCRVPWELSRSGTDRLIIDKGMGNQ